MNIVTIGYCRENEKWVVGTVVTDQEYRVPEIHSEVCEKECFNTLAEALHYIKTTYCVEWLMSGIDKSQLREKLWDLER
jgi:hypothetical protein